jgi:dimethylaniline monooxygenase (N-oxide forming)
MVTGTCGLSTLKTLREDGFKVTGFERRERVGGLWAYTEDTSMTSALKSSPLVRSGCTRANT